MVGAKGLICCFYLLIGYVTANVISYDTRIVGGMPAKLGQFKYQVSIQEAVSRFHFCGGSLVSNKHVLTAAHCVQNKKEATIRVWAGGITLQHNGEIRSVKRIFSHKQYSNVTFEFDVAVLLLEMPFLTSHYINPIPLATQSIKFDTPCLISGWGKTHENANSGVINLLFATVNIVNTKVCDYTYNSHHINIRDSMICAKGKYSPKDACQGDSGGPLAYNNTIVGIVSFGLGCGSNVYPGVYTNVSAHYSWIQDQLAKSNGCYIEASYLQVLAMIIACVLYPIFDN